MYSCPSSLGQDIQRFRHTKQDQPNLVEVEVVLERDAWAVLLLAIRLLYTLQHLLMDRYVLYNGRKESMSLSD